MPIRLRSCLTAAALAAAPLLYAHQHGATEHASTTTHRHGVHEHGVAHADIAIEADSVRIELTVTGADLVGFEGEVADAAARARLEDARRKLAAGAAWFTFEPAGQCRAAGAGVLATPTADDHHAHEHDSSDKHVPAHRREHADVYAHDEEPEDSHPPDHSEGEAHADPSPKASSPADWQVSYRYACTDGTRLRRLGTTLFAELPSLSELRVQLVAPAAQAGATLTPQAPTLDFGAD